MDATSFTREDAAMRVRPYVATDTTFVLSLAPRLLIGLAPWRDPERMLVEACEHWAREQGLPFLVLHTGAANGRARSFYQHLGFREEDVKLVKPLSDAS